MILKEARFIHSIIVGLCQPTFDARVVIPDQSQDFARKLARKGYRITTYAGLWCAILTLFDDLGAEGGLVSEQVDKDGLLFKNLHDPQKTIRGVNGPSEVVERRVIKILTNEGELIAMDTNRHNTDLGRGRNLSPMQANIIKAGFNIDSKEKEDLVGWSRQRKEIHAILSIQHASLQARFLEDNEVLDLGLSIPAS